MIKRYLAYGWAIIPVPLDSKAPVVKGWQERHFPASTFPASYGGNVGVVLGARSGGLVDIDLDAPEAIALGARCLPLTYAVFGRPSKAHSHRLYISPGATFTTFADPTTGEMLLELRADGRTGGVHQSLLPPSRTSGERRAWAEDRIVPLPVAAPQLERSCAWLAARCLALRYIGKDAVRLQGADLLRLLGKTDKRLAGAARHWLNLEPPRRVTQRSNRSADEIDLAAVVGSIPNDCSWIDWNRIGLAIFAASGGSDHGFEVFDEWSSTSPKYNSRTTYARWANFHRCPPTRIGMGTLVFLARQNGWTRRAA